MTLVDYQIRELAEQSDLIDSYDPNCLTNIGYDLRAKYAVIEDQQQTSVFLQPGESAFVASVDVFTLPKDLLCRIVLKNSRIRQGFTLDAPVYQPGHKTRIYFRLTNVSGNELQITAGDTYATAIFERLSTEPEHPYTGAFSDEFQFKGLGKYKEVYHSQIRELEKKRMDLKGMERSIYANVLVILTVFVALFSFLMTNLSLLSSSAETGRFLIYNFSLLGCISFLVALLNGVIGVRVRRWVPWAAAAVCFAVAIGLFLL